MQTGATVVRQRCGGWCGGGAAVVRRWCGGGAAVRSCLRQIRNRVTQAKRIISAADGAGARSSARGVPGRQSTDAGYVDLLKT